MKFMKFAFTGAIFVLLLATAFSIQSTNALSLNDDATCTDPTETVKVAAISGLKFNLSEIKLPKDTCVSIIFENKDTQFHDFVVDETGDLHAIDINADPGVIANITFKTPNTDISTEFYCSVSGHREAGMYGTFIIGEGSGGGGVPGFGFATAFLAMFALIAVPIVRRR